MEPSSAHHAAYTVPSPTSGVCASAHNEVSRRTKYPSEAGTRHDREGATSMDGDGTTDHDYIRDKVIVVTGAGSGFGRLVAQKTAARGASVVAVDVNEATVGETVALITAAGGRAVGVVA